MKFLTNWTKKSSNYLHITIKAKLKDLQFEQLVWNLSQENVWTICYNLLAVKICHRYNTIVFNKLYLTCLLINKLCFDALPPWPAHHFHSPAAEGEK